MSVSAFGLARVGVILIMTGALAACGGGAPSQSALKLSGGAGASTGGATGSTTTTTTGGTPTSATTATSNGKAVVIYLPSAASQSVGAMSTAAGNPVAVTREKDTSGYQVAATLTTAGTISGNSGTIAAPSTGRLDYNQCIIAGVQCMQAGSNPAPNTPFIYDQGRTFIPGTGLKVLLTDANFGLFSAPNSSNGSLYIGGYHDGNLTPAASLPSNVTATYSGYFEGFQVAGPTTGPASTSRLGVNVAGDVALSANFTQGTIAGQVSNIVSFGTTTATPFNLNLNGNITGNTYSGTVQYQTLAGQSTPGGNSSWNGAFYGTGAKETAGALAFDGKTPLTPATNTTIVGSYGAKKN